jgi:glycosyltransferase involved in cell wall biosynthesis
MKFSIVIPWYGNQIDRIRNFDNTTKSILDQTLPRENLELILVKDTESGHTLYEEVADTVVTLKNRPLFNKAWFLNNAIRQVKYDWFFQLDAEAILDKNHLQDISDFMDKYSEYVFIPFDTIRWMERDGTHRFLDYSSVDVFGMGFCMKKYEYFYYGGECENFDGHGSEDADLYERHKKHSHHMQYIITHQYHTRAQTSFENNARLSIVCRTRQEDVKMRQMAIRDKIGNPDGPTLIKFDDLEDQARVDELLRTVFKRGRR